MNPVERLQRLLDTYPGSFVRIENGGRSFTAILALRERGKECSELGRGQAGSVADAVVALHASVLARSAQNYTNARTHYVTLGGDPEATTNGDGSKP